MKQRKDRQKSSGVASPISAGVAKSNEALIEHYLEWKRTHSPRAAEAYAIWVRRFQNFTNKEPENLIARDWTSFARSIEGRFAPMTIQFAMNIVHNYLRFWQMQYRLPNFDLGLARVRAARANSHRAVTEEEYQRMVDHLKSKGDDRLRDLAIIMLLHDTGMRVGELVRLEIGEVDEDASAIIQTEKTIRDRRVFWDKNTDATLHRLIVQRVNSHAESDWLFVRKQKAGTRGETPLITRSVQRIVARAAKEAGIDAHVSPHSFRHAMIHRLAKRGVPDALIAQVVGHTTPHTIAHYTKLSRPEIEEVVRDHFRPMPVAA